MSGTKKLEEGFEKIKAAEKSLKTSLLKWRPDYEVAAEEYSQAATCFRNARSFERSKDCLLKAADCHKHNHSFFHAAKCLEQAIYLAKDLNDFKGIPQLAERACALYQQHGSPESAVALLDKAAKIIEQIEPEQALRLYQKAVDVVLIEDSYRQAAEFMSKVSRLMVKLHMYDQATDAIQREIALHQRIDQIPAVGRLAVCLILVQLARGDFIAAEKAFKEWGHCCDASEVQNLEMLLRGFDEEDPEVVREALNDPFIKHMDVEYARLARDLPLPEENCGPKMYILNNSMGPPYMTTIPPNVQKPADLGEPPPAQDDDNEDGGLC